MADKFPQESVQFAQEFSELTSSFSLLSSTEKQLKYVFEEEEEGTIECVCTWK